MGSTLSSSSSSSRSRASTKPSAKQYMCYMCSKIFDSIETLDSHKRLEHSNKPRQSKPPAEVG